MIELSKLLLPNSVKSVKVSKAVQNKAFKTVVDEVVDHFKNADYPLDKFYLIEDLLFKILGYHVSDELNSRILKEGFVLEYNQYGSFIRKTEEYIPIYMNKHNGKIQVVEDPLNWKSKLKYITNEWEYIGELNN